MPNVPGTAKYDGCPIPIQIRMVSMTKKTDVQQCREWRVTRAAPFLTQIKMVSMMRKTNVLTRLVWHATRVALSLTQMVMV
jgi:hypothetical protein